MSNDKLSPELMQALWEAGKAAAKHLGLGEPEYMTVCGRGEEIAMQEEKAIKWYKLTHEQRDMIMAQKVMHLEPKVCEGSISWDHGIWRCLECGTDGTRHEPTAHMVPTPRYSQSLDAAWLVVEHLSCVPVSREEIQKQRTTRFMLWWEKANLWAYRRDDAANRICVAALRMCDYEVLTEEVSQ